MITTRGTLVGALTLGMAVSLSLPVQAATDWSEPQQISSRYGSELALSDDGSIAVWIRTESTTDYEPLGPLRTSRYRGTKKGWAKSAEIPGTAESSGVRLSGDGGTALVEMSGGGYGVAERLSGTTWSPPQEIATGIRLYGGKMSADGNTVAWVEYGPQTGLPMPPPATLWIRSRTPGGSWDAAVMVGTVAGMAEYRRHLVPALSRDGGTVAWLSEDYAMRAAVRDSTGAWVQTTVIKQYPTLPQLSGGQLSASGRRIIWTRDGSPGVITATRSGLDWSVPGYVTVAPVDSASVSPKGSTVAWVSNNTLLVRRWKDGAWNKPVELGSAGSQTGIVTTNSTIAWVKANGSKTILRTATLSKGKWTVSGKIAKDARRPALSFDGGTLAWSATQGKELLSENR